MAGIADVIAAASALDEAEKAVTGLDAEEIRLQSRLDELKRSRVSLESKLTQCKRSLKEAVGAVL